MKKLLEAIRAVFASFRYVTRHVFEGGKWVAKTVAERVAMPAIRAADAVANYAIELPGRALAPLVRARAAGAGPKTAAAANQAQQQIQEQSAEAKKTHYVAEQALALQRAAKFKALGHDWQAKFGDVLSENGVRYLRALTVAECKLLADTDVRVLARIVSEGPDVAPVPGVRSVTAALSVPQPTKDAPAYGGPATAPTPVPGAEPADYSPAEQRVLARLSERLIARGRKPRNDDEEPGLGSALRA